MERDKKMDDRMVGIFGILVVPIVMLATRPLMVFFESSTITIDVKKFRKISLVYVGLFVLPIVPMSLFAVLTFIGVLSVSGLSQIMDYAFMPLLAGWALMHTFYMPRVYVQRARAVGKGKGVAYVGTFPLPLFVPFPLLDLLAMITLATAKEPPAIESI